MGCLLFTRSLTPALLFLEEFVLDVRSNGYTRLRNDFLTCQSKDIFPKAPSCCVCSATPTAQASSALNSFSLNKQKKFSQEFTEVTCKVRPANAKKHLKESLHIILQAHSKTLPTLSLKILHQTPPSITPESPCAAAARPRAPAPSHGRTAGLHPSRAMRL